MKAAALRGALSDRAANGRIAVVSGFVDGDQPRTSDAMAVLRTAIGLLEARLNFRVLVVAEAEDEVTWKSLRNAPGVRLLATGQLNTYDVLASDHIVFTEAALSAFTGQPATPAKASTAKADTAKADTAKADTAKADTAKADTAKADTAKADTAKADTAKATPAKASTAKASKPEPESADADAAEPKAPAAVPPRRRVTTSELDPDPGPPGHPAAPGDLGKDIPACRRRQVHLPGRPRRQPDPGPAGGRGRVRVKVTGVNTLNRQGKRRRTRFGWGQRAATKRAIVSLAEGERIDVFGGPVS